MFLCEIETPYILLPKQCVIKQSKVLNNDKLAQESFVDMFKEFEMQRRIQHEGIVKTMYFLKRTKPGKRRGEEEMELNLILEHMQGGDLQKYLNK